jgi:DNA-binding transcriptional LysR family regulator
MELQQVRYFLAVATTLNFTRAAEQCNVTQPALTKGVQKLERELGGQLIYRERQLTQLTDLGKEVLPILERTLWSLFEERYVAVLAPTHQLANRLSIGIDDLRETILLERAGCDVAPKIRRTYFPDEPPHLGHCSGHDLHLQHMAAAGFGVILAPEHMPRLPTLKTIPLEGEPVSRKVRLLAVRGRGYSPALDAFVKVVRLRDWSVKSPAGACRMGFAA